LEEEIELQAAQDQSGRLNQVYTRLNQIDAFSAPARASALLSGENSVFFFTLIPHSHVYLFSIFFVVSCNRGVIFIQSFFFLTSFVRSIEPISALLLKSHRSRVLIRNAGNGD
jgi:hypothetical protein